MLSLYLTGSVDDEHPLSRVPVGAAVGAHIAPAVTVAGPHHPASVPHTLSRASSPSHGTTTTTTSQPSSPPLQRPLPNWTRSVQYPSGCHLPLFSSLGCCAGARATVELKERFEKLAFWLPTRHRRTGSESSTHLWAAVVPHQPWLEKQVSGRAISALQGVAGV